MTGQNHSTNIITEQDSIDAASSKKYMIDTEGSQGISVFVRYRWPLTGATPTIAIAQTYGMDYGAVDGGILEAENVDNVPGLPQPDANNTDPELHVWQWNIPIDQLAKYVFLNVVNGDMDNPIDLLDILVDRR